MTLPTYKYKSSLAEHDKLTVFMLRIMACVCTRTPIPRKVCIVTRPYQQMAIKLIKPVENIFERKLDMVFENNATL
jgi:hypothetical protein